MTPHNSNECPVAPNTLVRVEYRTGAPFISTGAYLAARLFNWVQSNAPSDIVAYEVKQL